MRTKNVIRYYCDHCSKGGFKKPNMAEHEATCTLNPKRACWLCEDAGAGRDYKSLVNQMRLRNDVHSDTEEETGRPDSYSTHSKEAIGWLSSECGGCPACVLSVLRQGKIFAFDVFDYKACVSSWHAEQNREFRDAVFNPVE